MLFALLGWALIWIVSNSNLKNKKKHACITIVIVLSLLAVTRALTAPDIVNYIDRYKTLHSTSFSYLFGTYLNGDLKDPFFYIFAKLFADVGLPAELWVNSIAVFFAASFGNFVYRTSDNPAMSYLIVICFYFRFTLTGLRQTMALSVILFALLMLLNRKPVKFVILVLVAVLFHSSALVLLPMYWVSSLRPGKKQYIMIAAGVLAVMVLPNSLRLLIQNFAWNETFESYSERTVALTWSGFIIQFIVVIFALIFRYHEEDDGYDGKKIERFLNLLVFGTFFQAFSTVIAEAFRLSYYFSLCSVSVLPLIVSHQSNPRNRKILTIIVPAVFLVYFAYVCYQHQSLIWFA